MRVLDSLSKIQRKSLVKGVIEVRGKAMNRTALGVVDAMFQLYPNATFEEMKQMLPDSINPSAPKNYKSIFKPYNPDRPYGVIQPSSIIGECEGTDIEIHKSHFTAPEERFKTADGVEVLVSRTWETNDTETGGSDLQRLIDHVQQYGVRVVQVEKKEAFNKGDYHLEVINPTLLSALVSPPEKKGIEWWVWLILALFLLGGFLAFRGCQKPAVTSAAPVVKVDSVPVAPAAAPAPAPVIATALDSVAQDIEEGESVDGRKVTFRNIPFQKGKSDLLAGSDTILNEVSGFLKKYQSIRMEIVGHCSDEGSQKINKKLSEARAKSVYQYLLSDSIPADRLTFKGLGSTVPIAQGTSDSARAQNRRTEFIIKQNEK
jgi:outer membrane protein OmpA-like peptidoglycan-associated protein